VRHVDTVSISSFLSQNVVRPFHVSKIGHARATLDTPGFRRRRLSSPGLGMGVPGLYKAPAQELGILISLPGRHGAHIHVERHLHTSIIHDSPKALWPGNL
jgi:hypothetical protein